MALAPPSSVKGAWEFHPQAWAGKCLQDVISQLPLAASGSVTLILTEVSSQDLHVYSGNFTHIKFFSPFHKTRYVGAVTP